MAAPAIFVLHRHTSWRCYCVAAPWDCLGGRDLEWAKIFVFAAFANVPVQLIRSCNVFLAVGSVFVLAEDFHGTVIPTNVVFQLPACGLWTSLDSNWARDRKACGLCGVGPVHPRCDSFESGGCEELSSPRAPFLAIVGPPASLYGASSTALMLLGS